MPFWLYFNIFIFHFNYLFHSNTKHSPSLPHLLSSTSIPSAHTLTLSLPYTPTTPLTSPLHIPYTILTPPTLSLTPPPFTLPPFISSLHRGMATSFEGKHGSIRYWLKAEIDKPWSFNTKVKKCFTVISPIDINIPEYMVRESERERERERDRER